MKIQIQKARNKIMMKKGLARVSVFMMVAAIATSVAACTPQDKKGGAKNPTETTVQAKVSREKTKKEKTKNPGKKKDENAKIEAPTKAVEAPGKVTEWPKQEAKGPGADQAQGPGVNETSPKTPTGNDAMKPSAEPSKGQTGEKAPKASEGVKEQDAKKDEKKSAANKKKENGEKKKLSQKKSDSKLKKKAAEKKSDGKQAKNSGNGATGHAVKLKPNICTS
ncbi:MAG: hypothetical protein HFF17_16765 [Oscillospiraceae bacterium]|nr:hypothetical protein [Oscillospiraceae bacterium]